MITLAVRLSRLKMVRFGVIGVVNTLIDLAVFAVAISVGTPALLANVAGWIVAVAFSYFANSRWSFQRDRTLGDARSALRFILLGALITLGVSSGAIVALAEPIGVMPAKILGLIVAAILNFIAAKWSIENRLW